VAAVVAGLALTAACSQKNQMDEDPTAAPDSVTGTVRQVGNTPFTRIIVEGEDASLRVTGDLEEEVSRLVGARVLVVGSRVEGEGPEPALQAAGYEILSVDGATPRVGTLDHEAGEGYRLLTEDGEALPLRGVPDGLGARLGAKVWIVLGDGGAVQRYGILREPEDAGS
jgi:hypothetical protein